jgi:hypothetical protein
MPRSAKKFWLLFLIGISVFYILGIFVRSCYGTRWDVVNESGVTLREVSLGFSGWKYQQELPIQDLGPGQRRRIFFRPCMKSSYVLNFTGADGVHRSENGEQYIPGGDCSYIKVRILGSGKAEMTLPTHPLICWKSWFDLI